MLGLLLVAGGKYTTYRVMAADVIDRAVRRLGGPARPSRTDQLPLLGADGYAAAWRDRQDIARRHGVTRRGGRAPPRAVRDPDRPPARHDRRPTRRWPRRWPARPEYLAAEVAYAALAEGALHLDDVLTRRTRISIETAHRGTESAEHAAAIMGDALGWDKAVRDREIEHYLARVAAERQSQTMPDDLTADAARIGVPGRTRLRRRPAVSACSHAGPLILVDEPLWPARGRLWSHLVSDLSYAELHVFAEMLGAPRRAFDRDHYDIPAAPVPQRASGSARRCCRPASWPPACAPPACAARNTCTVSASARHRRR